MIIYLELKNLYKSFEIKNFDGYDTRGHSRILFIRTCLIECLKI